jgi:hypothetical protein
MLGTHNGESTGTLIGGTGKIGSSCRPKLKEETQKIIILSPIRNWDSKIV